MLLRTPHPPPSPRLFSEALAGVRLGCVSCGAPGPSPVPVGWHARRMPSSPAPVPQVLVSGSMSASDEMVSRELTVLFADIESFSTISETISPQDLVEVCTPYFEKMCRQIVKRNGTIDKFIGDCIMAMWNAPLEVCRGGTRAPGRWGVWAGGGRGGGCGEVRSRLVEAF